MLKDLKLSPIKGIFLYKIPLEEIKTESFQFE